MKSKRRLGVISIMLGLMVLLAPSMAFADSENANPDNNGNCPSGFTKISDGFEGLSWTADADYDIVILVGGPPEAEKNKDPDGRDKYFYDVESGDTISREAHNISHICVKGDTSTTTSTTEPTTTTTVRETTTTTVEGTTTTVEGTTTTQPEETTTVPEVTTTVPGTTSTPPRAVPSTTTPTPEQPEELPFTGSEGTIPLTLAGVLLVASGVGLLNQSRKLSEE